MKRFYVVFLLFFLGLLLIGCASDTNHEGDFTTAAPGITGYVTNRTVFENIGPHEYILVVATEPKYYGENEHYNAMHLSNAPDSIEVGDKVEVWHGDVDDTYPGMSKIEHVEVISRDSPKGAHLTEAQALAQALKSTNKERIVAATSIEFDDKEKQWHFTFKVPKEFSAEYEEVEVSVKDEL
ncbi:DUF3221 domain-containing protein [Evansella sp. AB-P1]|uniref:DUF3221 domain-containing protein n=1 Tax=Evansella sp. AB-P1 TaxID=3037653 RepID=UPI00241F02A2|nr:DUF3221 domain-containing protein [Evansella sp. AB-P1]MDG5788636.1 DUF3221 domain-containing protein [Evansella sp. AB-P1]